MAHPQAGVVCSVCLRVCLSVCLRVRFQCIYYSMIIDLKNQRSMQIADTDADKSDILMYI